MYPGVPVTIHVTDPYEGVSRRPSIVGLFVDGGRRRMALITGSSRQILLPPGRHELRLSYTLYQHRGGGARIVVDTTSGRPVDVYYAAPFTGFEPGAVGFQPNPRAMRTQRRVRSTNRVLLIVFGVAVLALLLLVFGLFLHTVYAADQVHL